MNAALHARARNVVRAESRLPLVEFLLGSDDVTACAQRTIDWICTHSRTREALCLAVDADSKYLLGLAGRGIPADRMTDFSLDVEEHSHPLVDVLSNAEAVFFVRGPHQPQTPLAGSFHALPLRSHRQQYAAGVLLV